MEEEVVNKKTEEGKKKNRTSLKSILGGDILATDFFRRQTKLLVLIMVFIIFYIHMEPLLAFTRFHASKSTSSRYTLS